MPKPPGPDRTDKPEKPPTTIPHHDDIELVPLSDENIPVHKPAQKGTVDRPEGGHAARARGKKPESERSRKALTPIEQAAYFVRLAVKTAMPENKWENHDKTEWAEQVAIRWLERFLNRKLDDDQIASLKEAFEKVYPVGERKVTYPGINREVLAALRFAEHEVVDKDVSQDRGKRLKTHEALTLAGRELKWAAETVQDWYENKLLKGLGATLKDDKVKSLTNAYFREYIRHHQVRLLSQREGHE